MLVDFANGMWCRTSKDGGFQKLDKFVDLDEHVDSHLQLRTFIISIVHVRSEELHTISAEDCMPARMLEQEDTRRR